MGGDPTWSAGSTYEPPGFHHAGTAEALFAVETLVAAGAWVATCVAAGAETAGLDTVGGFTAGTACTAAGMVGLITETTGLTVGMAGFTAGSVGFGMLMTGREIMTGTAAWLA